MTFRPTRRQILTAALATAASGAVVPIILTEKPAHAAATGTINLNLQPLTPTRQNTYPIVLVHGFAGFGRNGFHGLVKYWGGLHGDIQQDLVNLGFQTVTAAIGPFSSNWDRACELYAQIKGGTVDYGLAHSQKFGHARFGRTFSGLLPQWGQTNANGGINKVHLIGHSMGAQTMRRLAQLLGQGSAEEMAATPPGQISPLFTGGKANWIDSITTISGTHNGSSLTNITQQVLPTAPQLLAVAALFGNVDQQLIGYDFNLDQWGLTRMPGESLAQFISRINASGFAHSKDTAETDLLPDTAAMLNQAVTAQPDNFLFSVQTLTTQAGANDFQVAEGSTDPPLIPLANAIGKFTSNKGQIPITPQWWPNDGLTNTNFMPGPILNTTDVIATFNGQSVQRAKWYPLGTLDMVDHLQVIGFGTQDPKPLYRTLAAFVASLPQ